MKGKEYLERLKKIEEELGNLAVDMWIDEDFEMYPVFRDLILDSELNIKAARVRLEKDIQEAQ